MWIRILEEKKEDNNEDKGTEMGFGWYFGDWGDDGRVELGDEGMGVDE